MNVWNTWKKTVVRMAKAIYNILSSVFPARMGKAWYSMNMLEMMHSLNTAFSIASSIQCSSSEFCLIPAVA